LVIDYILYSFHLPCRQKEGIIKATGKNLPSKPSYGHGYKRINKLDINITNDNTYNDDDENGYDRQKMRQECIERYSMIDNNAIRFNIAKIDENTVLRTQL
jgi:hypothetical protein